MADATSEMIEDTDLIDTATTPAPAAVKNVISVESRSSSEIHNSTTATTQVAVDDDDDDDDDDVVMLEERTIQVVKTNSTRAPRAKLPQSSSSLTTSQTEASEIKTLTSEKALAAGVKRPAAANLPQQPLKKTKTPSGPVPRQVDDDTVEIPDDSEEEDYSESQSDASSDERNNVMVAPKRPGSKIISRKKLTAEERLHKDIADLKALQKKTIRLLKQKQNQKLEDMKQQYNEKLCKKDEAFAAGRKKLHGDLQKKLNEARSICDRKLNATKVSTDKQIADMKTKIENTQAESKQKVEDAQKESKDAKDEAKEKVKVANQEKEAAIKEAKEESKEAIKKMKEEKEEAIKQLKPDYSTNSKALKNRIEELRILTEQLTMGNEMANQTLEAREQEVVKLKTVIDEKEAQILKLGEKHTVEAFRGPTAEQLTKELGIRTKSLKIQQRCTEEEVRQKHWFMRLNKTLDRQLDRKNEDIGKLQAQVQELQAAALPH